MNPILQQIIDNIGDKVKPEDKDDFDRAVTAGKHILFDPSTHANMELIKNPDSRKDPINTISTGIAGLGYLMYVQSKKTLPPEALIPACIVLMCHVFDFAERGLGIQTDNNTIARTTEMFMQKVFEKMGVSPEQLQEAINKGAAEIQAHQEGQQAPPEAQPEAQSPGGMLAQGGA